MGDDPPTSLSRFGLSSEFILLVELLNHPNNQQKVKSFPEIVPEAREGSKFPSSIEKKLTGLLLASNPEREGHFPTPLGGC